MLVSATEMLQKAKAGHYAVGQFNIKQPGVDKSNPDSSRGMQITGYPGSI